MIFAYEIECNLNHRQGGISAASNFKIFSFETSDSLHLKLYGDFDGNSAHELLNTLKKYGDGFYQIFIDTDDIKTIYPFGRDVFQKKLSGCETIVNITSTAGGFGLQGGVLFKSSPDEHLVKCPDCYKVNQNENNYRKKEA